MFLKAVVALAVFAGVVSAQTNATYIDPNSVTDQLKSSWCTGEHNVCKVLCDMNDKVNTCDISTLTFACTCQANNSSPDVALYINSLPYYICIQSFGLCIIANQNDQQGQDNCKTNIQAKCGTLNISDYSPAASSASSTSAGASATAASSGSATAASASPSATKKSAAGAIKFGSEYGFSIFAAGLLAIFALLL